MSSDDALVELSAVGDSAQQVVEDHLEEHKSSSSSPPELQPLSPRQAGPPPQAIRRPGTAQELEEKQQEQLRHSPAAGDAFRPSEAEKVQILEAMEKLRLNARREQDQIGVPLQVDSARERLRCSDEELLNKQVGEPVVLLENIAKWYKLDGREDVVTAIRDINLTQDSPIPAIRRGEFVMIRGPSGGGKSTLLNLIGTIDDPSQGTVNLFGETVDKQSSDAYKADLRLRRIGFVFQTFNLLATLSAFENVELPMIVLGKLSRAESKRRAKALLDMVGLRDRYSHLPSELSGGEQQRVAIARALANEPDLLLLDEATGDLDRRNAVSVMDLLLDLNIKGCTMIMVTHDPDLECYADRIIYVEDGTLRRQAINRYQTRIDFDSYMEALNSRRG